MGRFGDLHSQLSAAVMADLRGPDLARRMAEAHSELHARTLREQEAREGVAPGFRHVVDGRRGADFTSVKPGGVIVTVYDYRREIAAYALKALRRASPVSSGAYRDAWFVTVDGQEVAEVPAQLADDAVITISNTVPYARRLEVGKRDDGRPFVVQVPPGIVERVAKRIVLPRYRDVAKISFGYVDLANAYRLKRTQRTRAAQNRRSSAFRAGREFVATRKDRTAGQPIRYPAIVIRSL